MFENKLILGDNLEVLKSLPSESVDLIYLDPPFFSGRNYEVIWGDKGEVRSFKDRWEGGLNHYISWLKERVFEMHRILKNTGSIYLHCDHHADAYIRVHILDPIFGDKNFKSCICWKRTVPKGNSKALANNTDTIYWYVKTDKKFIYNPEFLALEGNHYSRTDNKGRIYRTSSLKAPSKGYKYEWNGVVANWRCSLEKMKEYEAEGRIKYTSSGVAEYIRYLDESNGRALDNCWIDIPPVNSQAKERIGYPTQKPESLLERIIKASSNEGDIVLDPFVGGGTTISVADRLGRKWIGIDSSVHAIKVSEQRIKNNQIKAGERRAETGQDSLLFKEKPFEVKLYKYDYDEIRKMDDRKFEFFIIEHYEAGSKVNASSNKYAIDGYTKSLNIPIQVKRQDSVGTKIVDNILTASKMEDKSRFERLVNAGEPVAIIIAFSFAKTAFDRVAEIKNQGEGIIKLVKVGDIIPLKQKPNLEIAFEDKGVNEKQERVILFTAKTEKQFEFFQWDFNFNEEIGFNASIMVDREGVQEKAFAKGEQIIACKVIDEDGIEKQEVIKLVINGAVKKV